MYVSGQFATPRIAQAHTSITGPARPGGAANENVTTHPPYARCHGVVGALTTPTLNRLLDLEQGRHEARRVGMS
jgi:hypothetical protein